MASPSIPPTESEKGADSLDDVLSDADAAVAVVAPPFAGRDSILDRAAAALDAPTRVRLSFDSPDFDLDDGATVLDDCHHRYAHRIGGFDPLDDALDRIASSSGRTVTSWNRHSWNYLDAVRDLAADFDHVLSVSSLSTEHLAEVVHPPDGVWPTFEHPSSGRASLVTSVECRVPIPRRDGDSLAFRLPTVDVDYLAEWLRSRDPPTARDLVFQRLARISGGNPGVAAAVWEQCADGTVTPDDIALPVERGRDVSDDAARVLGVLVPKEAVAREELAAVVSDVALDRTLRTLVADGFVDDDGDVIRLRPGGLPSALESLERRRWLW